MPATDVRTLGFSPVLSVFWATILAIVVSALRSDTAVAPWWLALPLLASLVVILPQLLGYPANEVINEYNWILIFGALGIGAVLGLFAPHVAPSTEKLARALKDGTTGVLNVAATCATAGIIVGEPTLLAPVVTLRCAALPSLAPDGCVPCAIATLRLAPKTSPPRGA